MKYKKSQPTILLIVTVIILIIYVIIGKNFLEKEKYNYDNDYCDCSILE